MSIMKNEGNSPSAAPAVRTEVPYARFFKPGQKIFLRTLSANPALPRHFESLTSFLKDCSSAFFDLFLPYQVREGEELPFAAGTEFELRSESMGLGLRLKGIFVKAIARDLLRFEIVGDLQAFQNRLSARCDLTAGLRYTRGLGTLRTFREQWEKNIQILARGANPSTLGNFPRTRINLSSGGIRFSLKAPVEAGSLCLILLEFEPDKAPVCTLAEVLWTGAVAEDRQPAGMRFINILETDQKRIDDLVRRHAAEVKSGG
jgi:hypothetical protein